LRECYAYLWDEFGSAGSYQGDDGVIQFNFGGVGGVWRANTRKRECWRYAGVVGDMDVSGSAVYGGMNVVGNADICGCAINFWVECGSAGSYQGNDGVNRHNLGALVVAGGAGISGR
jgi:hypothetical protein